MDSRRDPAHRQGLLLTESSPLRHNRTRYLTGASRVSSRVGYLLFVDVS